MIPGGECSRCVLGGDEAVSETVPLLSVLFLVGLEILPEVVGGRVFLGYLIIQYVLQPEVAWFDFGELELHIITEPDDEDPRSVVGDH